MRLRANGMERRLSPDEGAEQHMEADGSSVCVVPGRLPSLSESQLFQFCPNCSTDKKRTRSARKQAEEAREGSQTQEEETEQARKREGTEKTQEDSFWSPREAVETFKYRKQHGRILTEHPQETFIGELYASPQYLVI